MISEQMRRALSLAAVPFDQREPWDLVELLAQQEAIPYKVALRRLEKAETKGYVEYGTSIRGAWLTSDGKAALAEKRSLHELEP